MFVDADGPADPGLAWQRFVTPAEWPEFAPQISRAECDDEVLRPGSTGRVSGYGVTVDFTIDDVDHDRRSFTWTVGIGPVRERMVHHVLPTAQGGSRAVLRVDGPQGLVIQPYRWVARLALARLVDGPATSDPERVASHDFAFASPYAVAGLPFGVTPGSTRLEVGPHWLYVRFGPWRLLTARSNVAGTEVTGDFAFAKTAGPPHLSFADRGVSFCTNGDRALCVQFHEPVPVLDPSGTLRHPGATFSVADPERLAADLA